MIESLVKNNGSNMPNAKNGNLSSERRREVFKFTPSQIIENIAIKEFEVQNNTDANNTSSNYSVIKTSPQANQDSSQNLIRQLTTGIKRNQKEKLKLMLKNNQNDLYQHTEDIKTTQTKASVKKASFHKAPTGTFSLDRIGDESVNGKHVVNMKNQTVILKEVNVSLMFHQIINNYLEAK